MLRRADLLALLAAQIVSVTGSMMTALALPWFVLTTTGSPAQMSMVVAAEFLAMIAFGIPLGPVAARLGARRTMLAADLSLAPVVALIPALHAVGLLSFPLLVALAFLTGVFVAPYAAATTVALVEIAEEDEHVLARANSAFQTASRLTYLVGPAVAGVLIAWLGAPAVLVIDAATYVVSFVLIAVFVPETKREPDAESAHGVLAGLRCLAGDRFLRAWTVAQVGSQTAFLALTIALPVLAFVRYDGSAAVAGLLLAAWGGGAFAGSLAAYPVVGRWPALRVGRVAWLVYALPLWLLVARLPVGAVAATLVVSGFGNGFRNPPMQAFVALRIPARVRAQALTAFGSLAMTGSVVASVATGAATEVLGLTAAFAGIAAVLTGSALLFVAASRRLESDG
jgi:MFS family permease